MSTVTELSNDISQMKSTLQDYYAFDDDSIREDLVSFVPKLLDLADLLVAMLEEEEIEANKEAEEQTDTDKITSEEMVLRGMALIQRGFALQKMESELLFTELALSEPFDKRAVGARFMEFYNTNNLAPNSVISCFI